MNNYNLVKMKPALLLFALSAAILLLVVVAIVMYGNRVGSDKNISDRQSPAQSSAYAAVPPLVPTEPMTATATVVGTAVGTAIATSTPEIIGTVDVQATHEAFETAVTERRQEIQTEVALTHAPTTTPGRPQERPSPTPMLGMLPGCSNTNVYEPQAISCWRGVVDGELVDVDAGREGMDGDPEQGILRVHIHGGQGDDIYQTPDRVGAVRIVSVNGVLFTLETVDQPTPQQFVFDLDTRSWVSP